MRHGKTLSTLIFLIIFTPIAIVISLVINSDMKFAEWLDAMAKDFGTLASEYIFLYKQFKKK